jgi:hypothetical protein
MYVHGTYMFMNVNKCMDVVLTRLCSFTTPLLIRPDQPRVACESQLRAGSAPSEQPSSWHQSFQPTDHPGTDCHVQTATATCLPHTHSCYCVTPAMRCCSVTAAHREARPLQHNLHHLDRDCPHLHPPLHKGYPSVLLLHLCVGHENCRDNRLNHVCTWYIHVHTVYIHVQDTLYVGTTISNILHIHFWYYIFYIFDIFLHILHICNIFPCIFLVIFRFIFLRYFVIFDTFCTYYFAYSLHISLHEPEYIEDDLDGMIINPKHSSDNELQNVVEARLKQYEKEYNESQHEYYIDEIEVCSNALNIIVVFSPSGQCIGQIRKEHAPYFEAEQAAQ